MRPYFQSSIGELEDLFRSSKNDLNVLWALYEELQFRSTARALSLRAKVKEAFISADSKRFGHKIAVEEHIPHQSLSVDSVQLKNPEPQSVNENLSDGGSLHSASSKDSPRTDVYSEDTVLLSQNMIQEDGSIIFDGMFGTIADGIKTSSSAENIDPRSLLQKLLAYIEEQAKQIDPHAYRLAAIRGFIRHPHEISGLPNVDFDIKVEGDHVWLRVARIKAVLPPPLPEECKRMFLVSDDPDGPPPQLDEAAFQRWLNDAARTKTSEERTYIENSGRLRFANELERHITLWKSWADGERPRRKTITLYSELFALKRQLEADETTKAQELVWGIGVSTWNLKATGDSIQYEYPLLTQAVEISIDDKTMAIEIRPRETDTRMEMDAFIACQVPGAAGVEKTGREHLRKTKERPVTPFDPSSYVDVLRLVAGNLESKGSYRELLAKREIVPPPGEHLIVSDNWVIFSRPRLNNFLLDDLKRLQEKLASGCSIPEGPLALVTAPSDIHVEYEPLRFRGISSRGDSGSEKVEELFFPLPYNEEQITIVRCLERAPGITVQGPPGTGKTHTIANIICHYLATGRRVLVTSRGEPALQVLQSKIPEEVQPLTVALLASDREGMRQFQNSIRAIQHQVSQLNPGETRTAIANLQSSIDRAHTELTKIDRRVDEIAVVQLSEVEVDGERMRAQQIAELVVFGQDRYGWFDDELSLASEHAPPLSLDETRELREARRKLGLDLVYVTAQTPSADSLPPASKVGELHDLLTRIWRIEDEVSRGELASLKAYTDDILSAARDLIASIEEAEMLAAELETPNNAWSVALREKCRQSFLTPSVRPSNPCFTTLTRSLRREPNF